MKYEYDLITIGLGPAGMAVSIMASEMGLKVCAIEKHKIGGECMNVGCIPSKALLRIAGARSAFDKLEKLGLAGCVKPALQKPFERIDEHIRFIREKKTMKMFKKVELVYRQAQPALLIHIRSRPAERDTQRSGFLSVLVRGRRFRNLRGLKKLAA